MRHGIAAFAVAVVTAGVLSLERNRRNSQAPLTPF